MPNMRLQTYEIKEKKKCFLSPHDLVCWGGAYLLLTIGLI